METKKELKTCPWCGAQNAYGFVKRDIGRSEGMFCNKCNYFKAGK